VFVVANKKFLFSIKQGGFHSGGGTILQMPNFSAISFILFFFGFY
jgi:hypothetical protein